MSLGRERQQIHKRSFIKLLEERGSLGPLCTGVRYETWHTCVELKLHTSAPQQLPQGTDIERPKIPHCSSITVFMVLQATCIYALPLQLVLALYIKMLQDNCHVIYSSSTLLLTYNFFGSREIVVDVMTRPRAGQTKKFGLIPYRSKGLSTSPNCYDRFWGPPCLIFKECRRKSGRGVQLTTEQHPVFWFRMRAHITPLSHAPTWGTRGHLYFHQVSFFLRKPLEVQGVM